MARSENDSAVVRIARAAGRRLGALSLAVLAAASTPLSGQPGDDTNRRIALAGDSERRPAAGDERRVALVIGNDAYRHQPPLASAVNDARAMKSTLRELGFDVNLVEDADLATMEREVKDFSERLRPGDVGLFYYAGHGIQIDGENFLVPVDFIAEDELDARYASYSANRALDYMVRSNAQLNVVILDACRDNPFVASRTGRRGLASMSAERGTLIAFATGPGRIASDGPDGVNGLFTTSLIETLPRPGLSLDQIFNQVSHQVDRKSGGRQTPWVVKSLPGDYYFRPATNGDKGGFLERAFWDSVKSSDDPEELKAYLAAYPSGQFAELARIRLRRFPQSGSAEAPASPRCEAVNECTNRGYELQMRGGEGNLRRAAEYYRQGCRQGEARACTNLGVLYQRGQGVFQDPVKAAELYRESCDEGDSLGCTYLGFMYEKGRGVFASPVRAYESFSIGCDDGHAIACTHLGMLYENGSGVDRDYRRASRLYSEGCKGEHAPGCRRLGQLYENGLGTTANPSLAAELYRLACDGRDAEACSDLATLCRERRYAACR